MSGFGKKIGLATGALVAALVVGEVLLRVLGVGVVTPALSFGENARSAFEQGRFEADDDLFWTLPETAGAYERVLNAVHPRREVPPKRTGRRRVMIIGDSCSFLAGSGGPYSVRLQRELFPAGCEVLNAAVPGYSTHQGLAWLRLQLLAAEPDVAVIYFGWNDHWRATGVTDRGYAASRSPWSPRLAGLSRGGERPLRVSVDEYRANLRAMVDELRASGGEVVLVAAPSRFTDEARRRLVETGYLAVDDDVAVLHERYLEVVRGFEGEPGVRVLKADHVFRRLGDAVPLLHRDGIHPTDAAHEVLAALLADLIAPDADGPDPMGRARRALLEAASEGGGR